MNVGITYIIRSDSGCYYNCYVGANESWTAMKAKEDL